MNDLNNIVLSIEDMTLLKRKYVYVLKNKGVVVYVGVCTYGVSFIHAHRGKEFDSAYILMIPEGKSAEEYKDELILQYQPQYNFDAEYIKKPKVDIVESEDLISLRKVRDLLYMCNLQDYYVNKSKVYPQYIEYPFVRKHKLHTTKYGVRSYISLSDFRSVMLQEHDIDINKYLN